MNHLEKIRSIIRANNEKKAFQLIVEYVDKNLGPGGKYVKYVCGACMTDPFGDCGCGGRNQTLPISVDETSSVTKCSVV